MALDTAIRISGTFSDELGTNAAAQLYAIIDSSISVATMQSDAENAMFVLAELSGGHLKDVVISVVPAIGTQPVALAGARVEQCGLFNFSNDTDPRRWAAVVPAFLNSKVSSGKINLSDFTVQTFINALIATSTTFRFTSPQGHLLVSFLDAIISFRKKRRQLSRTSFEV